MSRHLVIEDEDLITVPSDIRLHARTCSKVYGRYSIVYHKIEELISTKAPEAFRTAAEIRRRVRESNKVTFSAEALASALSVSRPTISRHLKQLRELGVLVPQFETPGQAWLLHPLYGWYGGGKAKDKYWEELTAEHPFKQMMIEENLPEPDEDEDEE